MNHRPLHSELPPHLTRHGHAGLWYEKYCGMWRGNGGVTWNLKAYEEVHGDGTREKKDPRLDWVRTVAGATYVQAAGQALLDEHLARQWNLCADRKGISLRFKTTSRLVVGVGLVHPIENGFLWHPVLGVPYVPGTSIKGMLRAWLRDWQGDETRRCWFEKLLVGTKAKGVGELIFFDALPASVPPLEADVITPHYGPYYRNPRDNPPADWHSPTPAPFLTVAKNAVFMFSIARRDGEALPDGERDALDEALRDAFATIGIGARTAVGYGRLAFVDVVAQAPALPEVVDPLQALKSFCDGLTDFKNQGKRQLDLVEKIKVLSVRDRETLVSYLLETKGSNPADYKSKLKAIVFPNQP